jgi:hypothetical protein
MVETALSWMIEILCNKSHYSAQLGKWGVRKESLRGSYAGVLRRTWDEEFKSKEKNTLFALYRECWIVWQGFSVKRCAEIV